MNTRDWTASTVTTIAEPIKGYLTPHLTIRFLKNNRLVFKLYIAKFEDMKEKDNQTKTLIVGLILCVVGLVLQSWYSTKTATIEYVDKKCLDVKMEIQSDQEDIKTNLRDLNRKTDKILELMIPKK